MCHSGYPAAGQVKDIAGKIVFDTLTFAYILAEKMSFTSKKRDHRLRDPALAGS
jgi:hypothetical protein